MFILKLNADSYSDVDEEQPDEYPLRPLICTRVAEAGSVACVTAQWLKCRCRSYICIGREVATGDPHLPLARRRDYGVSPGRELSLGSAYYRRGDDRCAVRRLHAARHRPARRRVDEAEGDQEGVRLLEEWHQFTTLAGAVQVTFIL